MRQVWLLDESRRLAPIGTPAEIYFGGIVAAGYLAQPELTAARFVANPLLEADSNCARQLRALGMDASHVRDDTLVPTSLIVFRTGDVAVRRASGELFYRGRADRQVKIRGFRIELGDIEAAARKVWPDEPMEVAAVVISDEIVLFVVADVEQGARGLRAHCQGELPPYMVPSRVVALESFPRLVSGKIDMGALKRGEHDGQVVESAFSHHELAFTSLAQVMRSRVQSVGGVAIYRVPVEGQVHALVADHIVLGRLVFPATGYLVVAQTAVNASVRQTTLRSTFFLKPLDLDDQSGIFMECTVDQKSFQVRSAAGADSSVHCSGALINDADSGWQRVDYASMHSRASARAAHVATVYDNLHAQGLEYGPGYRTLGRAWSSFETAHARLQARTTQQGTDVHPADLDDALCLDQLLSMRSGAGSAETRLPFVVDDALLQGTTSELWAVRSFESLFRIIALSNQRVDRCACIDLMLLALRRVWRSRVLSPLRYGSGLSMISVNRSSTASGRVHCGPRLWHSGTCISQSGARSM